MLKLWESHRRGKEKYTTITGNLEEWQSWFLGQDKRLPAVLDKDGASVSGKIVISD